MPGILASNLAPQVNAYTLRPGPPKTIVVPGASSLAALQGVTVSGVLLRKQTIAISRATGQRTVALGANGGAYGIEADGDLHFCLGIQELAPHITCEVQHAATWLPTFRTSIGQSIAATGFFRCLFEHPGFDANDDAHIFEIHPVNAVTLGGTLRNFDVGLPDPGSIHTWTAPHPLNDQDAKIRVAYDRARDTLTFANMDGQDENYVREIGTVRSVQMTRRGAAPASFTFTSPEIGHPLQVVTLPGTSAARQLARLTATNIVLVGLRDIDLAQALLGEYVIRLLAIDIQPAT